MICRNCGKQVPDTAKYCPVCHVNLLNKNAVPSTPAKPPVPVSPAKPIIPQPSPIRRNQTQYSYNDYKQDIFSILISNAIGVLFNGSNAFFQLIAAIFQALEELQHYNDEDKANALMKDIVFSLADFDYLTVKSDLDFGTFLNFASNSVIMFNLDLNGIPSMQKFYLQENDARNLANGLYQRANQDLSAAYSNLISTASYFRSKKMGFSSMSDTDRSGTTLKFMAAGALAAVNPLIGIPALLAGIASQQNKNAMQDAFWDDIVNQLQLTVKYTLTLNENLEEFHKNYLYKLIGDSVNQILDSKHRELCKILDNDQCRISKYYQDVIDSLAGDYRTEKRQGNGESFFCLMLEYAATLCPSQYFKGILNT